MFKRIMAILLVAVAAVAMTACVPKVDSEGQKIVLITDKGDIDDKSFNQGSYDGVKAFGDKYKVEYAYLKPREATNEAYIAAIEQAIANGATIIVTPGFLFEGPINVVQTMYPNVKFIILDGSPANAEGGTLEKNVYSVFYAEEQTGFLAGYAAVKEGFRKLGFMGGMAVPAVQRFGHGFVQGAAYAAKEEGLAEGAITVDYLYTGDFKASPEVQAAAATLYQNGVEIIFACGGAVGQSVMAAAKAAGGKWVIGVDVDQSGDSETVITSSTKELAVSVQQALEAIFGVSKEKLTWEDDFAGKSVILDVTRDGVGLPMETSRFTKFKKSQYNAIYNKIVKGDVKVSTTIGEFGDDGNAAKLFETKEVKVRVVPFAG
ncbi:MAG: BMP family lipoprotein [Acholeplasmataceae bacterium]|jgi:basic membrane protein A